MQVLHYYLLLFLLIFSFALQANEADFNRLVSDFHTEKNQVDKKVVDSINSLVRQHPEKAIELIAPLSKDTDRLTNEQLNFVYEWLTIAHYNIANLNRAAEYNQMQLDNFAAYPFDLLDSLNSYSNKMILFYTLNRPTDALKSAVALEKRLSRFNFSTKLVRMYRQVTILYNLLGLTDESYALATETLEKIQDKNHQTYQSDFMLIISEHYLSFNQPDKAKDYLHQALSLTDEPGIERKRIYAFLANTSIHLNDIDSAFFYFEKSFNYYHRYPEILSMAGVLAQYSKLLMKFPDDNKINSLRRNLNYIKRFNDKDNLPLQRDLLTIELSISSMTESIDQEILQKIYKRDSIAEVLWNLDQRQAIQNLNAQFQSDLKDLSIKNLKEKNKQKELVLQYFYFALLFVGICLILSIVAVVFYRKNFKAQKQLSELEAQRMNEKMEIEKKEKQKIEEERNKMQINMQKSLTKIEKQNALFNRLDELIKQVRKSDTLSEAEKMLQNFNMELKEFNEGIFEDEVMNDFKAMYPDKHRKLLDLLLSENNSEFLYAALVLMKFSTREIAISLNKTEKAVRSIRYRLRKKLKIEEDVDLIKFLNEL